MTLDILILGGTAEGRRLAERLAADRRFRATLSLAGRTADPLPLAVPARFGGFGGERGLADYIADKRIGALVVATHPFAARIAVNAAAAVRSTGVPALQWLRPAWERQAGDDWHLFSSLERLVDAIGEAPRRVFVTIGRQEAHAFERAPQHHYLFRTIDPIDPPLAFPHAMVLLARGPLAVEDEMRLMTEHGIELLVAKMSGGAATYAKIEAARRLRLPVYLVDRPAPADLARVETLAEVTEWLDQLAERAERGE
ncbi:cobalt-precorrin-6A reductase [Kaistia algarum]|uniref:cobalt-precorrin-6A reductase n=1 Tax=Kaistia algarum TaxID=2083279 RepID=UPI000CE86115|nr:cobalt-precorrin-6A reductase [Kaistia algarum]MCX5513083.1 cobalt-precorrin-6A reductase [Kaistia algarum]PPE81442.1 cobalt-precorrin-6A reductase [Kaistia algarum]